MYIPVGKDDIFPRLLVNQFLVNNEHSGIFVSHFSSDIVCFVNTLQTA